MVGGSFQVQYLYTAGIGFDLGGAYLLARGLIATPRMLALVSGSYYGSNAYLGVSVARDRLDAISGVSALALGFSVQLVGYLLVLDKVFAQHHGSVNVLFGLACAAVAVALTVAAGEVHRH